MPSPDLLDDYAVCQILIDAAIDEIYEEKHEKDSAYLPWGGLFPARIQRSN
jgi:hypothetical protein